MENFDRWCLLIASIFRQAHRDACQGDRDAADFLAWYGAEAKQQGHRSIAGKQRCRRCTTKERDKVQA